MTKWMQGLLAAEAADQAGERDAFIEAMICDRDFVGVSDFDRGATDYFNNKDYRDENN